MPPDDDGKEKVSRSIFQKYKWIIIPIAILIILFIGIYVRGRFTSSAAEPTVTLTTVNADVVALKTRVTNEETKSASQAIDIADILSDIDALQTLVADLEISDDWIPTVNQISADLAELENIVSNLDDTDWSANITYLNVVLNELSDKVDDLWSSYFCIPLVTHSEKVGDYYIDVTIKEDGDYPVIVTLYGNGLETGEIVRRFEVYDIKEAWAVDTISGDVILTVVIEPDVEWEADDLIELKATVGEVYYATANVGKEQETGVTGW